MKEKTKNDIFMLAASVALYAVFQGLIMAEVINAYWERNIVYVCINIILAASLNLINGITGQFSIGHAGFMAVGAYVGAIMTVKLGLPFVVAIAAGAIAAGILGFVIGLPTLRLSGDYLAIATLGLGEIIRITILNIPYVGGASGLMGIPKLTNFTWAFFLMIFTLFFIKNFVNSTHGRACISSARTRSPPKPWASTPPNTKSSPSPSAPPSPAWPEPSSPTIPTSPTPPPSPSCAPSTS